MAKPGPGHGGRTTSAASFTATLKPAQQSCWRRNGTPKITDFGLAKRLEEDQGRTRKRGRHGGRPSYMACFGGPCSWASP